MSFQHIVEKYDMKPHPEGGYFVETYRAEQRVEFDSGNGQGKTERSASTAILFLVTPDCVSRLHRITSDEVWHFHAGGPMTVIELLDGGFKATTLGNDLDAADQMIQYCVKKDTWFGSFGNEGTAFSLVGCTVSPGFEFADFELGSRKKLLEEFPNAKEVIIKLTEGLP